MDANYLLYRQQISLHKAETAACRDSRRVHRQLAKGYGDRLEALHPFAQREQAA